MVNDNRVAALNFRIKEVEAELHELRPVVTNLAVLRTEVNNMTDQIEEIGKGLKSLRTTLIVTSLGVASSAVGYAIITILAFGSPHLGK